MGKEYKIATDGGARGNGKGVSSWAFVVYDIEGFRLGSKSEGFGTVSGHTNNKMEITAILKALQWLKKHGAKATIYTDSNYSVQGINTWMHNWKRNMWRTSQNKPVKNVEEWREVYHLAKEVDFQIVHVPGHAVGNHFEAYSNREADALCNVAMDEQEFKEYVLK